MTTHKLTADCRNTCGTDANGAGTFLDSQVTCPLCKGEVPARLKALDLFAGAGGWDVAGQRLGWQMDGVEVWSPALATREAAGLHTVGADVRDLDVRAGIYDGLIGSPPCPPFSKGGKESGNLEMAKLLWAARAERFDLDYADPRTGLVLEPLRLALRMMPDFIAWEQVPTVLPIWQACAEVLRSRGYSVDTGILHSEEYGVPQVRKRAILVARLQGEAFLPAPVRQRFGTQGNLPRAVTQAEALGWGMTERPYPTLASARTTGGPDKEKVGGSGARKILFREQAAGRWIPRDNRGVLTLEEAAILQTFPAGFPFQGYKTEQFAQITNAIPCLLAEAIFTAVTR